jgi:hypothetical protein
MAKVMVEELLSFGLPKMFVLIICLMSVSKLRCKLRSSIIADFSHVGTQMYVHCILHSSYMLTLVGVST